MAKRLDVSPASLENVVHEYMNAEGNGKFPSDSIVLERLAPAPLKEATKKSYDLWQQRYSKPIPTKTYQEAVAVQQEATKYYPKESVTIKETFDGHYEVLVGEFTSDAVENIDAAPKEESVAEVAPTESNTSESFNIEGKSLKDFLRDKGLIHTFDPSVGEADRKAMYVTRGDGTYSIKAQINQIYNHHKLI